MSALKPSLKCSLALLCVVIFCVHCCTAQQPAKDPKTWWPHPSSGLMWAGQAYEPPPSNKRNPWDAGITWQDANAYCASLTLGGFSGWRLPTLDEVKTATFIRKVPGPLPNTMGESKHMAEMDVWISQIPVDTTFFKGGIDVSGVTWTSTIRDSASAYTSARIMVLWDMGLLLTRHAAALCTRPMEADLLQVAKDAQVNRPVTDVQTLKNFIPLNKARLAF